MPPAPSPYLNWAQPATDTVLDDLEAPHISSAAMTEGLQHLIDQGPFCAHQVDRINALLSDPKWHGSTVAACANPYLNHDPRISARIRTCSARDIIEALRAKDPAQSFVNLVLDHCHRTDDEDGERAATRMWDHIPQSSRTAYFKALNAYDFDRLLFWAHHMFLPTHHITTILQVLVDGLTTHRVPWETETPKEDLYRLAKVMVSRSDLTASHATLIYAVGEALTTRAHHGNATVAFLDIVWNPRTPDGVMSRLANTRSRKLFDIVTGASANRHSVAFVGAALNAHAPQALIALRTPEARDRARVLFNNATIRAALTDLTAATTRWGQLEPHEATRLLHVLLDVAPSPWVWDHSLATFASLGEPSPGAALANHVLASPRDRTRADFIAWAMTHPAESLRTHVTARLPFRSMVQVAAQDPHEQVRVAACQHPQFDAAMAEGMLRDPSVRVRRVVARVPGLSGAALSVLVHDEDLEVQEAVADQLAAALTP